MILLVLERSQAFIKLGTALLSKTLRNREMGIMGIKVKRVHLQMKNIKDCCDPLFP